MGATWTATITDDSELRALAVRLKRAYRLAGSAIRVAARTGETDLADSIHALALDHGDLYRDVLHAMPVLAAARRGRNHQ